MYQSAQQKPEFFTTAFHQRENISINPPPKPPGIKANNVTVT